MSSSASELVGRALTWEQYAALPEDPRVEYVDGRLLVSPSPTRAHQEVCFRLVGLLKTVLPKGWGVTSAWAWRPGPGSGSGVGSDEYIPDVMVHPATEEQVRFTGAPALCVKVLSTNRGDDLVLKAGRYARAGLPHYWVVDPRDGELTAYSLTGDGVYRRDAVLRLVADAPGEGSARLSAGPVDVVVDLAALLSP